MQDRTEEPRHTVSEPEDPAAAPLETSEPVDPKIALFAQAAAAVQAGQPVAAVLAQYPQYQAELELLLGTVAAVAAARLRAGGTGQIAGWSPDGSSATTPRVAAAPSVVVSPTRSPTRSPTQPPNLRSGWRGAPLRWVAGLVVLAGLGWIVKPLLLPAPVAPHLLSYNDPIEAIAGNHWRIAGNDVLIDAQTQISGTPAVGALANGVGEEIAGGSRARTIRIEAPPTATVAVAQATATADQVSAISPIPSAEPVSATPAPPTATAPEPTATAPEPTATEPAPTATDITVVVATQQPATAVTGRRPTGTTTPRGSVTGKPLPTAAPTARPTRSPTPTPRRTPRTPTAEPSATPRPDPVISPVGEPSPSDTPQPPAVPTVTDTPPALPSATPQPPSLPPATDTPPPPVLPTATLELPSVISPTP